MFDRILKKFSLDEVHFTILQPLLKLQTITRSDAYQKVSGR